MKKLKITLAISLTVIAMLWIIGRITNMLQYFSVPTTSNQPTYKTGTHFFASNLITPKRFDFICYLVKDAEYGQQTWFHRVCGLPGDTIEIKEGDLFVNGVNADQALNLKKMYAVPKKLVASMDFEEGDAIPLGNDSIIASLETIEQSAIIKQGKLYKGTDKTDPYIKAAYNQEWTSDNFGPYVVPPDTYFVMGDNRDKSQDSRYRGPVEKSKYLATIIK